MTVIHSIVQKHAVEADAARTAAYIERHKTEPHKLAMSGLGGCIREAFLKTFEHCDDHPLQRPPSHPFNPDQLALFEEGRMYEDQLYRELCASIDPGVVLREWRLGNEIWSGRPDFLIAPCGYFPQGAIIDCKATGAHSFAYTKGYIPRQGDCLQVLAYRFFIWQETGLVVPTYLYYRGWRSWAEFEIDEREDQGGRWIAHEGQIKGHDVSGQFDTDLSIEMARMENWWGFGSDVSILEAMDTDPLYFIPGYPAPDAENWGCCRQSGGKWFPRCRWLGVCWGGDFEGPGPFEV
jgi:hypothetical protein